MAMKLIDHIDQLSDVDRKFVHGVYRTLDSQAEAEGVIDLTETSDRDSEDGYD